MLDIGCFLISDWYGNSTTVIISGRHCPLLGTVGGNMEE